MTILRPHLMQTVVDGTQSFVGNLIAGQHQFDHAAVALQAFEQCLATADPQIVPTEINSLERCVLGEHLSQGHASRA